MPTEPSAGEHRPGHGTPHGETAYSPASILRVLTRNPLDIDSLREEDLEHPEDRSPQGRRVTACIALTSVALGLLVGVSVAELRGASAHESDRHRALVEQVEHQQAETARSAATHDRFAGELSRLEQEAAALGAPDEALLEGTAARAVAVQGPGVTVTLEDSDALAPAPGEASTTVNRVRDDDLQLAVNALWQLGAEAIAVNGVALGPTTPIRGAGEAILVDLRPLSSPYRIEAIGPAREMADGFEDTGSGAELARISRRYGLELTVAPQGALEIAPARSDLRQARTPANDAGGGTSP